MGPVAIIVLTFIVFSYFSKILREKIELFLLSNWKYRFLNALAAYIHYGEDIGIEATLKLDSPTEDVLRRRREGQSYLHSKLSPKDGAGKCSRGEILSASMVDCRFSLAKVCMPLLRELEFNNSGRNFIKEVRLAGITASNDGANGAGEVNESTAAGMITVVTEDNVSRPYVGNDAVHTLGIESFYAPIQKEVNRRMSLVDKSDSMLRFCPIAMNGELEKNVEMIKRLTGLDKVRYALSGSEAVDAALKDIQASCSNKPLIVRFKSAYHGHVSGVSFLSCDNHVFLTECEQSSIDFIERYHYRIAAVIVNPMQHFTGINKASPPGEKVTNSSRIRSAVPKIDYAKWLHSLQEKCNYCSKYLTKVAFAIDDVYFAFRTPELLSSKYFLHPETKTPLKPDVIILGKALAAGYPLSAVVGRNGFLNSYDKKYLLQVNKTVGTFSAWHGGLVASNIFLEVLEGKGGLLNVGAKEQFNILVHKCDGFVSSLNEKFAQKNLPLRMRNFSNTFSVDYLSKSLYNSRYPQYLLAEGMFLGNYSTGKFNLNADVTSSDWEYLEEKFVSAAIKMQRDGYFEPMSAMAKIKMCLSLMVRFVKNYAKIYYNQIMMDKHIDIQVSHNHPVNKWGHFWSSVGMIVMAYPSLFFYCKPLSGCTWFFLTHVVRQSGHFFYEHQDRNIEKLKFGHKDASKKEAVVFLISAALLYNFREVLWMYAIKFIDPSFLELSLDQYVLAIALFTVAPHFSEICYQYGCIRGLSWVLKILTDPFTDLIDFYTHALIHPKWFLDFKEHKATYKLDISTKKVVKVA